MGKIDRKTACIKKDRCKKPGMIPFQHKGRAQNHCREDKLNQILQKYRLPDFVIAIGRGDPSIHPDNKTLDR